MTVSSVAPTLAQHPSPLTRRGARRGVRFLLPVAIVLAEVAIGLMMFDPRFQRLVLLLAAGLAFAAVFAVPFAAFCGLAIVVGSVFLPGIVRFPVGPLELGLEEVMLGALVAVAVVRPRRAWWGGVAGGALAAFLGIVALSGLLAAYAGRVDLSTVYSWARPFAMLSAFYVVVRLFPEPGDVRRVVYAIVGIAALSGFVSVLVAFPGAPLVDLIREQDQGLVRSEEGLGVINRVRLPGVALAYVVFWYAAVRAIRASGTPQLLWLLALGGMATGLALSFNRNMWVGLAAGLVLIVVLGDPRTRRRIAISLLVLVGAAALIGLTVPKPSTTSPLYPLVERGATLFNPGETNQESSLGDRRYENAIAIETIERHPVLGVGPGAPFGVTGLFQLPSGRYIVDDQLFLHNQYLYLLLIGGVPGLVAFMIFLGSSLRAAAAGFNGDYELVALGVGVVLTMLSALVMISFAASAPAFVLAVLAGCIAVLFSSRTQNAPAG